jgi:hypothetical protein
MQRADGGDGDATPEADIADCAAGGIGNVVAGITGVTVVATTGAEATAPVGVSVGFSTVGGVDVGGTGITTTGGEAVEEASVSTAVDVVEDSAVGGTGVAAATTGGTSNTDWERAGGEAGGGDLMDGSTEVGTAAATESVISIVAYFSNTVFNSGEVRVDYRKRISRVHEELEV